MRKLQVVLQRNENIFYQQKLLFSSRPFTRQIRIPSL